MAVLTIQSFLRLFDTTPDNENAAITIPTVTESVPLQQETKSISDIAEQPSANPAPANNEFCTDSEMIRQQEKEKERQELIDNSRRQPSDNQNSNVVPAQAG